MTGDSPSRRPILLVEDDPGLSRLFQLVIAHARIANPIVAATSGGEAVAYLSGRQARPLVVLLDLGLPDMDGVEVLAFIRDRHDKAELPVVVMSGSVGASDIQRAMDRGANAFLAKPVAIEGLVATLTHLGLSESLQEAS